MRTFRVLGAVAVGLFFAMWVSFAGAQPAEKRIGLVIGNGGYQSGALATPANDAGLIAQTLQAAGFDVVGARDLDEDSLRHAVRDFVDKVTSAGPDTVAFVYFAGYGVQLEGENYLVPIDARLEHDTDVPVRALRLSDFLIRPLAALPLKASFIVLDAGRKNPFVQSGPPLAGGLALMDAPPGMLIAFNAAPGTVAPEGQGPYGPYAQSLAEMLRDPGLPVGDMFDRVRLRVSEMTSGAQVPWSVSQVQNAFLFFERAPDAPPPAAAIDPGIKTRSLRDLAPQEAYAAALERDNVPSYEEFLNTYPEDPMARRVRAILAARREAIVWRRTCAADMPDAYWSYLRRYPNGPHAYDARRRLARLAAALEPPPSFAPMAYDVPPPPPDEAVYIDRPVLAFDDPVFALPPPPPPPIFLLPPPPPEFVVLPPPPPPIGLFVLPMPIYRPIPIWARPPVYVAPPPPNNIIYNNIHNTVVVNQVTNTVVVTNRAGQQITPMGPRPGLAGPVGPQPGPAGTAGPIGPGGRPPGVAIGPSLPPSVAQKASVIQGGSGPGAGSQPGLPSGVRPGAPGVAPGTATLPRPGAPGGPPVPTTLSRPGGPVGPNQQGIANVPGGATQPGSASLPGGVRPGVGPAGTAGPTQPGTANLPGGVRPGVGPAGTSGPAPQGTANLPGGVKPTVAPTLGGPGGAAGQRPIGATMPPGTSGPKIGSTGTPPAGAVGPGRVGPVGTAPSTPSVANRPVGPAVRPVAPTPQTVTRPSAPAVVNRPVSVPTSPPVVRPVATPPVVRPAAPPPVMRPAAPPPVMRPAAPPPPVMRPAAPPPVVMRPAAPPPAVARPAAPAAAARCAVVNGKPVCR